jgi:hypothetical protein
VRAGQQRVLAGAPCSAVLSIGNKQLAPGSRVATWEIFWRARAVCSDAGTWQNVL